jgi:hypothetical protein
LESRQTSGDEPGTSTRFGFFGPDILEYLRKFAVSAADSGGWENAERPARARGKGEAKLNGAEL